MAMLDIRGIGNSRSSRESLNPWEWRRLYRSARQAGALADWLHNLADYASRDFTGFDAEWFWQEYGHLCRRFHRVSLVDYFGYRSHFQRHLERSRGKGAA